MEKPKEILELEKIIEKEIEQVDEINFSSVCYVIQDNRIIGLNLSGCKLTEIEFLENFQSIVFLNISGNQVSNISALEKLKDLEMIFIQYNEIKDISILEKLDKITILWAGHNEIADLSYLNTLQNLTILALHDNREIDFSTFNLQQRIKTKLNFEEKKLIHSFSNELRKDSISFSILKQISQIKQLVFLKLNLCEIEDLEPLKTYKNLITLDLNDNKISNLSALSVLENIEDLGLSGNKINDLIPLKNLHNIKYLGLIQNKINDLAPISNLYIKKGVIINCDRNPIENPPFIWGNEFEAIKAYFAEQKNIPSTPNPCVKLILTGNTTVGKTSLINFLIKQTFTEGEITTHGINQNTWKPTNTNLDINIWDFGGQEYYHSTHQMFFSNNALYLLMFDKQHNCNGWLQTEIDYADKGKVTEELEHFDYFYWLRNIRNLSDKSKILMLQNKVENIRDRIFPSNEVFDENLEFKVEDYQATSVLNAYNYYKENQKFSYDFEELQKLIINKLNEVKRGEIFEYYLKAKELIETAAQTKPVVSIAEFIEICNPANENIANIITDADGNETEYTAWKLMCVYFHETGVLLYYPDNPTLKEKIFIKPTFVTDTIYKVLNYKVKQDFGRFTFDDAVQSLENNTELAHDIIELMSGTNFKLIFSDPNNANIYFAPQYFNDNRPADNILKHIVKNMEIGFCLEFTNFLPKYILTEFMVNYGRFQKDDIIWKYGIVFEKYGTTAFVEILFNERMVVYKSDKLGEPERLKYEVFESLRTINRNDKQLKLGRDTENTYELEKVMRDGALQQFRLFRIGYENYQKQIELERATANYNKTPENQHSMENNKYNLKNIFNLLNQSFNDTDLEAFCMFHFETVKNNFGATQFKNQKIMALIEYSTRVDKIEELLNLMETENKVQFDANKPYLKDSISEKSVSAQNANTELLDLLRSKKLFLEKELITTYDSEKKFALQEQIKELEKQINKL